jgi:chlorophyllide a reductase subunit Z
VRNFLENDLGMPCTFSFARRAGVKPDNQAVREQIMANPPLIMFGSYNERMYLAEARSKAIFVPASFPGAVVRRHTGTPFMGYSGATYLVQEVCNSLFDALFNILPLAVDLDQVERTPSLIHREMAWAEDAKDELDRLVARKPVLVRISAAKSLRDAAERAARAEKAERVEFELLRKVAAGLGFERAVA